VAVAVGVAVGSSVAVGVGVSVGVAVGVVVGVLVCVEVGVAVGGIGVSVGGIGVLVSGRMASICCELPAEQAANNKNKGNNKANFMCEGSSVKILSPSKGYVLNSRAKFWYPTVIWQQAFDYSPVQETCATF
jgi:hypothetical protein